MDENWLRFSYSKRKFLVFDTETEDLRLIGNRPWQIYFQIMEGDYVTKKEDLYLKWPNLKVSRGAAIVSRYDSSVIEKQGVDPKSALDIFGGYLYDPQYAIVGSNILGFDSMVIGSALRDVGMRSDYSWLPRLYDTHCIGKGWKTGNLPKYGDDFLAWQFRILATKTKGVKTGLKALCKDFDIAYDDTVAHEAGYDVNKTWMVFKQLMYKTEL